MDSVTEFRIFKYSKKINQMVFFLFSSFNRLKTESEILFENHLFFRREKNSNFLFAFFFLLLLFVSLFSFPFFQAKQ